MSASVIPHPLLTGRPLGDRVIVQVDRVPGQSPGGIALPDTMLRAERPQVGVVVAVGPGRKLAPEDDAVTWREPRRVPMDVAVGDRIFFQGFAGSRLDPKDYRGDDDFLVLREDDIMVVLDRPTD